MNRVRSTFLTALLLAGGASAVTAQANNPAATPPAAVPVDKGGGELDLTKFPGQVIDEVIVPVPSEIFTVLDKLGDPDWKAEVSTTPKPNFSERTDVALLLGATVAGIIAAIMSAILGFNDLAIAQ